MGAGCLSEFTEFLETACDKAIVVLCRSLVAFSSELASVHLKKASMQKTVIRSDFSGAE
jgi:hypothetical protein